MRLVTFHPPNENSPRPGVLLNDKRVIDLPAASAAGVGGIEKLPREMLEILRLDDGLIRAQAVHDAALELWNGLEQFSHNIETCRIRTPVLYPTSIRDVPTFLDHASKGLAAIGSKVALEDIGNVPAYYRGNPATVIGPDEVAEYPSYAEDDLDFEVEFGIFIGRAGRDIQIADARSHIAGYAIFNDLSVRGRQMTEMKAGIGPGKGKDFDTGNVIGPWILVDDRFDASEVRYEARVNGEVWSSGNSAGMAWSFEELIVNCSQSETLQVGDFIAAGTLPGGCGLELDRYPKPGDVVELELTKLGTLRTFLGRGS